MPEQDRETGGRNDITRRDFLDGVALTIGGAAIGAAVSGPALAAEKAAAADYPPALQGLRGFDNNAMAAGHAVRDGQVAGPVVDTSEVYDLVVVGSGMSGLSAAYFYRKQIPGAKVLVLEGSDDFGGHARRVEFDVGGWQVLAPGGTIALAGPKTYSPESMQLLQDIGVDVNRFNTYAEADKPAIQLPGGKRAPTGMFLAKEHYGRDHLVADISTDRSAEQWRADLATAPLSDGAKAGFAKLQTDKTDHLAGLSAQEKARRLSSISYAAYLKDVAGIHPDAIDLASRMNYPMESSQAASIDTMSAFYAWRRGESGFAGLGERPPHNRSTLTNKPGKWVQFPDGNASVARLLVRWLIPGTLPGATMEDSIRAPMAYDKLDLPANDVRLRLSSMVTNVKHLGTPESAREVEVSYVRDGRAHKVRSRAVVLACFNAIIPHLVPELPEEQKAGLRMAVRKPLVQTWVAFRNSAAFYKLGVDSIACPGMFFLSIQQWEQSAVGGAYRKATGPNEPVIVLMELANHVLGEPGSGLPPRDQWRAGRARLETISFNTFEKNVRSQLDRVLGPAGFDSRRDIAGITVCRWAHGYAGGTNTLFDPDWTHRTDAPWVVGRKRFGRIAIANSDAAAVSLTNAAFDQSRRAVSEIVNDVVRPVYNYFWSESDTAGLPVDYPPLT
ncbi:spermidine dehydrogenase SpdH [Sphingomonas sp. DBB INV C78]|uniref:NAD(P)-binding protein n=1 Tax=Sphingomonas sp. DBB INV C78 TaxID=3349434 RepID=UPI0036D43276